jgi:hypothetical protein
MALDLDQATRHSLTRREWIRAGSLGLGGWSLSHAARPRQVSGAEARLISGGSGAGVAFGRAKSVILFWLTGGPAQQESWDPKPQAPLEVRGPFLPIATKTAGLDVYWKTGRSADCSTRRWLSGWANSAGLRSSTRTPAATIGATSSRSPWPARASAAESSTAPLIATPPILSKAASNPAT